MEQSVKMPTRITPDTWVFFVELLVIEDRAVENQFIRPFVRWRAYQPNSVVGDNLKFRCGPIVLPGQHQHSAILEDVRSWIVRTPSDRNMPRRKRNINPLERAAELFGRVNIRR